MSKNKNQPRAHGQIEEVRHDPYHPREKLPEPSFSGRGTRRLILVNTYDSPGTGSCRSVYEILRGERI